MTAPRTWVMAAEVPRVTTPLSPLVQVPQEEEEKEEVTTMILEDDSWVQEAVLQEDGPESEPFPRVLARAAPTRRQLEGRRGHSAAFESSVGAG